MDDDYDFAPTPNSNLANLFHASSSDFDSSSLMYTAPKQPKAVPANEPKAKEVKSESSIIVAQVVTVWKLCDNKYSSVGKLGLAIIGSEALNSYELILYKERRNVSCRVKITNTWDFTLSKDDFASFYDTDRQYWLIKFDSKDQRTSIASKIDNLGGRVVESVEKLEATKSEEIIAVKENETTKDDLLSESRADILSRIAKLGQSILPAEPSSPKPLNDNQIIQQFPPEIPTKSNPQPEPINIQPTISPTSYNLPMAIPTVTTPIMTCDPFNILYFENKTQSNEIKSSLGQVNDKLNEVLRRLETSNSNSNNNNVDSNNKNEAALKSRIKVLELQIENLNRTVARYEDKCKGLQRELAVSNAKESNYVTKLDEINAKLVCKKDVRDSESQCDPPVTAKSLIDESTTIKLRQLMSSMYENIMDKFDDSRQYSTDDIRMIVASNIKSMTKVISQKLLEDSPQ